VRRSFSINHDGESAIKINELKIMIQNIYLLPSQAKQTVFFLNVLGLSIGIAG
jgi:hypothetical protein